jgi:hypothetical protein
MSKATYTPGEWKQQGFRVYTGAVEGGLSRSIIDCNLSRVSNRDGRLSAAEFAECEANVALVLAAPALLAALEDIVEEAKKTIMMLPADLADSIRVFAVPAIAAARGTA